MFCVVLWALKEVVEDEEEDKDTVINCYQLYLIHANTYLPGLLP